MSKPTFSAPSVFCKTPSIINTSYSNLPIQPDAKQLNNLLNVNNTYIKSNLSNVNVTPLIRPL